jgi:peptide chain release factor 2
MKLGGIFDSELIKNQITELESQSQDPNFWNDRENAEKTMGTIKRLKNRIDPWEELLQRMEDTEELLSLALEEKDESLEEEVQEQLDQAEKVFEQLRILELFKGPHDAGSCFITIHSGAGGTEANDWAQMLLRMYSRYLEDKSMKITTLDLLEAEGGVKSVTIQVDGDYAYGYLHGETGVHRLVRISPFDSGGRRHTSFASVYVSPVIDDDIDIEIKPDEIRVDTYRASGAGGQHVNKTDSAVRITHLETNIVVQCQNERSQHKNRAMAMKMLKSRLYDFIKEQQDKERQEASAEKTDISWGNQIRNYVFQPYTLVKDNRTKVETGNIQSVMDGKIDHFIEAFLTLNASNKKG